jgi:hypothetical protein
MVSAVVLSQLLGCGDGSGPEGPSDNRGMRVAGFPEIEHLTWSTDGTEVYFIEGAFRLRASLASGAGSRILYATDVRIGHIFVGSARLYVSVPTTNAGTASRVLRINPVNAHIDTVLFRSGAGTYPIAVSDDERFLAYGDTLYDLEMATQRALPKGTPWSFSADASQLLYELQPPGALSSSFVLIATDDLSSQAVSGPAEPLGENRVTTSSHYWEGNEPKFLQVVRTAGVAEVFIVDGISGSERHLASIDSAGTAFSIPAAISADGRRAVVWTSAPRSQKLHRIDTETLATTIVATFAAVLDFVEEVHLSRDGVRAAYLVFGGGSFSGNATRQVYIVH